MQQVVLILHVAFAIALIVLILLQQGKGAAMGASFGGGASDTVFGSRGASSFIMKLTGSFAALFFVTSLVLGHFSGAMVSSQPKDNILANVTQLSKQQAQQQQEAARAAKQLNAPGTTTGIVNMSGTTSSKQHSAGGEKK